MTTMQDASENESLSIWENLLLNIKSIKNTTIIKPITLRTWSRLAWKQGYLEIAIKLREKAYDLNKNDISSRAMLCSALIHEKNINKTKIENILNNTDLTKDEVTDDNIIHILNIKGKYLTKIKKYKEAVECFYKGIEFDTQAWPYKGLIAGLIMDKEISNDKIIEQIKKFPKDSQWYVNPSMNQEFYRLMVESFFDKKKTKYFYQAFTPKAIAELTKRYSDEFMRYKFFDFYEAINSRFEDKELAQVYLTYYYFMGSYDEQATKILQNKKTINKINENIKNAL
jgi:tetratricopeptide (TPR) repeat protein